MQATADNVLSDDDASTIASFDAEFWKSYDDDMFNSPMAFDASEGGLWNGRFVPPPPRPPFMEENVVTDGLTTCDLCTWAFQEKNAFSLEGSLGKHSHCGRTNESDYVGWMESLLQVKNKSVMLPLTVKL